MPVLAQKPTKPSVDREVLSAGVPPADRCRTNQPPAWAGSSTRLVSCDQSPKQCCSVTGDAVEEAIIPSVVPE